jgi:2-oxoglutarate ferredoxin oxidoreductase subunit beta
MSLELNDIIKEENIVFKKSSVLLDTVMSYCPGCSHGVVHNLIAEVIEEMDIQSQTIGIAPVGCSVLAYNFMDIDWVQAPHGRATAVATGVKRLNPEKFVFTYQGDGDLAAIGTGETIHVCNRGDNLAIFFINNGIYGMTGGQMAPTTLIGQQTSTTPFGRDSKLNGYPVRITELIAQLPGTCYVTRQSVDTAVAIRKCKKAIRKAFENIPKNKGVSFVEVVSTCSSGWKMTPVKSNEWMRENMFPFFKPGDIKDI